MFVPLLVAAVVGLSVATVIYVARLVRFDVAAPRAGHAVMGVGTVCLAGAAIAGLLADGGVGQHAVPLIVLLVAVAICAVGLVAQVFWDSPVAGPVVAPLVAVVSSAILFKIELADPALATDGLRAVTVLHISATLVGFMLFIPAYVLSALFVGQVYRLKTKQLSSARLPSLMTLEQNGWRLLYIGFPIFTVGILLGVVWQDSVMSGLRPRHVFAALSWCVYAFAIYRRLATGWRGARAAVTVMVAFTVTVGAVLLYTLR